MNDPVNRINDAWPRVTNGSGSQEPTVLSRRTRAERWWSRQRRVTTTTGQPRTSSSVGVDSHQPSECLLPGVHTAPETWIVGTHRPQGVMLVESRGRREAPSLRLPPSRPLRGLAELTRSANDEIQAVEDNVIQKPRAWHAGYPSAIDQGQTLPNRGRLLTYSEEVQC
jgi:hypothetical protein